MKKGLNARARTSGVIPVPVSDSFIATKSPISSSLPASPQALVRLYAAARLHTNLFQPSFKLKQKTRIGARVIKRYHAPAIPAARVLAHPAVAEESQANIAAAPGPIRCS